MKTVSRFGMAALIAASVGAAHAQTTVYNNFTGPEHDGFDYNWGIGWSVAGPDVDIQFGVEQASAFSPSSSGPLSDIWVPIWEADLDDGHDEVSVRITENPDGSPPTEADILEQWTVTDMENWDAWSEPHHLVSQNQPMLDADESYWIWMVGGETTWAGWAHNNDPQVTLPHTLRREGEDWLGVADETAGGLRVDVVPAPMTAAPLLLGLGALRRRR